MLPPKSDVRKPKANTRLQHRASEAELAHVFSFKGKPVRTSRLSLSPRMRITCVLCASWRMLPRARFHHSATHENGLRYRKPLNGWRARQELNPRPPGS